MKYIEQNGNIFKEISPGKFEHVPRKVEQDGNVFTFNTKTKRYDFEMPQVSSEKADEYDIDKGLRASRVGLERAMTLYTRPTIAGVGSALGSFVGELEQGKTLGEAIREGGKSFTQGREEAILEQERLAKERPIESGIGELAGNIITSPLMPVKSLASALKLGAITGLGQAAGEATTKEEALSNIGTNLLAGAASFGIAKGLEKSFEKIIKSKDIPTIPKWKEEGYTFKYFPADIEGGDFKIVAFSKNNEPVGVARIRDYGDHIEHVPTKQLDVDIDHRRKGLASEMYRIAEEKSGKILKPSESMTEDAKKLWDNRKNNFGIKTKKGESYLDILMPEKVLSKIASTTTGIPDQDIITYAKNVDEINSMIKKFDGNIDVASDEAKIQLNNAIQKTRSNLNASISKALESAPEGKYVPINSIIEDINKVKGQINKKLNPEKIRSINDIISRVSSLKNKRGNVSVKELNDIKQFLQEEASDSFIKNGQIFPKDKDVARAARAGYSNAREFLNNLDNTIKEANNQLHQLHVLQDNLNKNILAVGKPSASLLAAGSKENIRARNQLELIGKITGTKPVEMVEKISAMKSFADTKILPQGAQTGYSLGRIATGAGIGGAIALAADGNPSTGAAIGAAMTGPTALKTLINSGSVSKKAIERALIQLNKPAVQSVIIRQAGTQEQGDAKIEAIRRRLMTAK
jgi:hypothetical protein